jgi:hypothetical protein
MSNKFVIPNDMPLWAQCIGGLIINFGSTEFLVLRWIEKLRGREFMLKSRREMFSGKVKIIRKIIPGSMLPESEKTKILAFLDEIVAHAVMRNRVAHNPLCFLTREATGEVVLSPIDINKMNPEGKSRLTGLSYSEIGEAALRVAAINLEMSLILDASPEHDFAEPHDP